MKNDITARPRRDVGRGWAAHEAREPVLAGATPPAGRTADAEHAGSEQDGRQEEQHGDGQCKEPQSGPSWNGPSLVVSEDREEEQEDVEDVEEDRRSE